MHKDTTLGARGHRTYHYLGYKFSRRQICYFLFFFTTKKTGFDISCNGDNLHETQILFSWKNEKNISKCRLLKILPSAKRYGLHKQITRSLCMAKPTIKLVRRDVSACTCTLILHISSLIRAFANRMCLLQSPGLTKPLVR